MMLVRGGRLVDRHHISRGVDGFHGRFPRVFGGDGGCSFHVSSRSFVDSQLVVELLLVVLALLVVDDPRTVLFLFFGFSVSPSVDFRLKSVSVSVCLCVHFLLESFRFVLELPFVSGGSSSHERLHVCVFASQLAIYGDEVVSGVLKFLDLSTSSENEERMSEDRQERRRR